MTELCRACVRNACRWETEARQHSRAESRFIKRLWRMNIVPGQSPRYLTVHSMVRKDLTEAYLVRAWGVVVHLAGLRWIHQGKDQSSDSCLCRHCSTHTDSFLFVLTVCTLSAISAQLSSRMRLLGQRWIWRLELLSPILYDRRRDQRCAPVVPDRHNDSPPKHSSGARDIQQPAANSGLLQAIGLCSG